MCEETLREKTKRNPLICLQVQHQHMIAAVAENPVEKRGGGVGKVERLRLRQGEHGRRLRVGNREFLLA